MRKLLTALYCSSLCIWLGTSVARMVVGYDVFVPGTVTLKSWYTPDRMYHAEWLYAQLGGWTGWSFGIMAVVGLTLSATNFRRWKQHGWLLMTLIFIVLLLPAQTFQILADARLWDLFKDSAGTANLANITPVFLERLTGVEHSMVSGLSILMGLTLAITLATQPLTSYNPSAEHIESR